MWKTVRLGDVCEFQSGLWKGKRKPFTKVRIIRNTNFTASGKLSFANVAEFDVEVKQLEKRQLEFGDIILEKSGGGDKTPVGRVCIFEETNPENLYSLSNFTSLMRIKDKKYLDCHYLHKVLFHMYISGMTKPMERHSTGIRNLQISQYKDIQFPLPPLTEQQRIVAKLDAVFAEIDKAVAATKRKQKEVDAFKQALLTSELNAGVGGTVRIGDVATVIAGQSPKGENYNKEGIGLPFYQGKKDYGEIYLNPPTVWTSQITKKATKNDILMSVRAPVGALNIATDDICIGRGLAAIRLSDDVSKDFVFFQLLNISKSLSGSAGAIFNSVNKKQIEDIVFPLPPLAEQQRIVAKLDAVFAKAETVMQATKKQIENYQALKSAFLKQELQSEAA